MKSKFKNVLLVWLILILVCLPIYAASVCGGHCNTPGKCSKYSDANSNKLCDLGETPKASATPTPAKAAWGTCRQNLHCPAPGKCKGYLDENHNQLCDRGETAPTTQPQATTKPQTKK